ncbi:MAG: DUF2752 domain-containing protein [Planctomycetes bacterium]|nr:DUF2752 domain-containing protein [Planctomycetota bacterium]
MRPGFTQSTTRQDAPLRVGRNERLVALAVSIGALSMMAVAAWLSPNARGMGTHCELGLPPCYWESNLDFPCPTCGMTTAFAHAADGHFIKAFLVQPMGLLLALLTVMAFWVALVVTLTGSRIGQSMVLFWRPATVWGLGFLTLISWLYTIWRSGAFS